MSSEFVPLPFVLVCSRSLGGTFRRATNRSLFTVADEIGLTLFDDPHGIQRNVQFSPDGNYFAV